MSFSNIVFDFVKNLLKKKKINVDVDDITFKRIINNCMTTSYYNFLISLDDIEMDCLFVWQFSEIINDKDYVFIVWDRFDKLCDDIIRFYNNSLKEFSFDNFIS